MKKILGGGLLLVATAAAAQEDTVVITATRVPQPSLEVPASVDRIYADEIREGRMQVNLSESLGRVPGIVVQNRQNSAQDLQISSRGFGARATFGVRGIRLIADGIPATMPDGQGQASTFALGSAERIEVLRGPFSALYGNAAGGVIAVDTADGPTAPTVAAGLYAGSYDTWKAAIGFGGQFGRLNAIGDLSRFDTEGYREHSAATRDQLNAKLKVGNLTLVANSLRQPDSQDPGGLDRAALEADPEQAGPNAIPFNTRKTVNQDQAGLRLQQPLGGTSSLEAVVYAGQRDVLQFLGFRGDFGLSSGGVVDLDRNYGGGALRFFTGETFRIAAGVEYERMDERRKGFVNDFGVIGALRRDEDDVVESTDFFAQAEWRFAERWSAHGGVRTSRVEFRSTDYFIVGANPDDSGERTYSETTPVAGLLYRYSKTLSLYGNVGRGFETPTFAELAHRNPPATGLNFALEAARSKHAELGVKALFPRLARVNAALFAIDTEDEIVVDVNAGGRTTFKNAAGTERRGFELGMETVMPGPWGAQFAYTYLDATFKEGFTSTVMGSPVTVPQGNMLPGVPKSQAYAQLSYRQPRFYTYLEALYRSRVPVDDVNSEFADAYAVFNLVAGLVQQGTGWRITEYVRLDNLADRDYVGSVIVNEANRRFYEPAPGRNITAGIQASVQF
jgi:iron complex outermembrane receptor protein